MSEAWQIDAWENDVAHQMTGSHHRAQWSSKAVPESLAWAAGASLENVRWDDSPEMPAREDWSTVYVHTVYAAGRLHSVWTTKREAEAAAFAVFALPDTYPVATDRVRLSQLQSASGYSPDPSRCEHCGITADDAEDWHVTNDDRELCGECNADEIHAIERVSY